MKSIIISYDEETRQSNVYDTFDMCYTCFCWNDNFEIVQEEPESDCEDFNDNARWLMKTLLEILKMEHKDNNAHCDWTADSDKGETGKYKFEVSLKKIRI